MMAATTTKYTPEFLRALLAWEGDKCSMPECKFEKMAVDSYYSKRFWRHPSWDEITQWNVCRFCQYQLRGVFRRHRKAYDRMRMFG